MILCVTLNPCLDKTLTVPPWRAGDSVRGHSLREIVGGKGNNVARALTRLGRPARPVTFLGGRIGERCRDLLVRSDRLDPLVVPTEAETRVILTVWTRETSSQTAFFDPDPQILPAEAEALSRVVQAALETGAIEAVTLSGSSPSTAAHGLFHDLIGLARGAKVPVFLDTYGPALDAIRSSWPDAFQLNRREAAAHLRVAAEDLTDAHVIDLLEAWSGRGVRYAIVTDGPSPVLAKLCGRLYRAIPPAIDAVNPIGSGDCSLAGITDAHLSGLDPVSILRHGLACAAANALVWDAGEIEPAEVGRRERAIVVEELNP
jgi:1-phosphofructokinase family hexose kinase